METYGNIHKKMLQCKGPESVNAQQVKGHASQEMVDQGTVTAEDKEGNDYADEAASKGSHDDQSRLLALTNLFSERHVAYQKFMSRVQRFLVKMKIAEKRAWDEKSVAANPLAVLKGGKKSNKVILAKQLKYADDGGPQGEHVEGNPCEKISINEVRKEECKTPNKFQQRHDVRNFLLRINWQKNDTHDGGITWLEVHALIRIQGEKWLKKATISNQGRTP